MSSNETAVALMGILVSLGMPVLLVGIILYFRHRKAQLVHETIAKLAEKGMPVTADMFASPPSRNAGLKAGLVLVALGIGLAIFFLEQGRTWSIGLIPGLMGVAMLIAWRIESRGKDGKAPPA